MQILLTVARNYKNFVKTAKYENLVGFISKTDDDDELHLRSASICFGKVALPGEGKEVEVHANV